MPNAICDLTPFYPAGSPTPTPEPPPSFSLSENSAKCRQDSITWLQNAADYSQYVKSLRTTYTLLGSVNDPQTAILLPRSAGSRYFTPGRKMIQRNIRTRLGRRWHAKGVLLTLTYDPKTTSRPAAWANFNLHFRTLMDTLNTRRRRAGSPALKYLWVLENQKGTGYPHLHIFFPSLYWLVDVADLRELWTYGRAECRFKDGINVAGYICKYISKLDGWNAWSFTFIWKLRKRLYGYSKVYTLPQPAQLQPAEYVFKYAIRTPHALAETARLFDHIRVPWVLAPLEKEAVT